MSTDAQIKQQVREFYDQVGWQLVGEDLYQNAHYEDLRPVSRRYIERCHRRVSRHIAKQGRLLLDAGSGPIQYPAYLEYSQGYRRRVCADISIVALQEARKRIGDHGLYVVCDVANLPFEDGVFDGAVSLHTIHHLPEDQHLQAYREIHRTLAEGRSAAIVNGWPSSRLMDFYEPLVRLVQRAQNFIRRRRGEPAPQKAAKQKKQAGPKGTFTNRHDVAWIKEQVGAYMPVEIWVWRSASVRFLRALVHPWSGGRLALALLYWLEERFPRFFGENGQYPLIVIHRSSQPRA